MPVTVLNRAGQRGGVAGASVRETQRQGLAGMESNNTGKRPADAQEPDRRRASARLRSNRVGGGIRPNPSRPAARPHVPAAQLECQPLRAGPGWASHSWHITASTSVAC